MALLADFRYFLKKVKVFERGFFNDAYYTLYSQKYQRGANMKQQNTAVFEGLTQKRYTNTKKSGHAMQHPINTECQTAIKPDENQSMEDKARITKPTRPKIGGVAELAT